VSRKVGNAVVRNYIKRNVREWFRHHQSMDVNLDLVVIARREARNLAGTEISGELTGLISRAGIEFGP
jgi:ribonuclease P protein component